MVRRYETQPENVGPLHDVRDPDKVHRIAASMEASGWVGMPIVVDPGRRALTGTHRLAAACDVMEVIPVIEIEDGDLTAEQWDDLQDARDDEERLAILERALSDDSDILEIMRAEVDKILD